MSTVSGTRPALRAPLLGRHIADVLGEHPPMPFGILDAVLAIAEGCLLDVGEDGRSGPLRTLVVTIHVVDVDAVPVTDERSLVDAAHRLAELGVASGTDIDAAGIAQHDQAVGELELDVTDRSIRLGVPQA